MRLMLHQPPPRLARQRKTGMAVGITPLEGAGSQERSLAWPLLVEAALVLIVIAALLPLFAPLASQDTGRDGRFAARAEASRGLPEKAHQDCASDPKLAPRTGIDRSCTRAGEGSTTRIDPRLLAVNAAKDEAMRTLLHTARWQWAGWALLGLLLLNGYRLGVAPALGVPVALASWAAAAWAGRVPWPLNSGHAFVFARTSESATAMPATFVLVMLAIAACALAIAPWLRAAMRGGRLVAASPVAYPGLVAATGIGWLLILDLSANGHFGNRYLALYHQGHLWLAMLIFTLVTFLRQPIGRALAWTLSLIDGLANRIERRTGTMGAAAILVPVALVATGLIASALANMRQLTSELGRLWLVVGAAWFFFMRGTPFTERIAQTGNSLRSLTRYTWPLVFVVIILIAAMLMTRDMGPLLIAGYGAGAFVAASVAMWLYQRRGSTAAAYTVAVLLFAAWIGATTLALFKLGSIDQVTAERIENADAPLVSVSDQMALVTWFQRAAPPAGFGPGNVPWCGFAASTTCGGVPAQIQSDYTFTALVGMFGWTLAWAITLSCALWLHETVRAHGLATRGEPRLTRLGGRIRSDEQAFLSWLCLAWVVMALCQLAVTVAGNLTVIPLTGVTFPFVSFGMTSLVLNMSMLALAINIRPPTAAT
jgi:cell division protein FtsW (lipid II flippase)